MVHGDILHRPTQTVKIVFLCGEIANGSWHSLNAPFRCEGVYFGTSLTRRSIGIDR